MLAVVMAAGVSLIGMAGASAAPANGHAISQAAEQTSSVTQVWGGCGRGWHRNRWGHFRLRFARGKGLTGALRHALSIALLKDSQTKHCAIMPSICCGSATTSSVPQLPQT